MKPPKSTNLQRQEDLRHTDFPYRSVNCGARQVGRDTQTERIALRKKSLGVSRLALVVSLGLLVRRLAGDLPGIIAAVLAALHPLMWINDMMLLSEGLYQPLIVAVL